MFSLQKKALNRRNPNASLVERLPTRATDENSFLAFAITIFVRMFIGVHAPMRAVVVMLEDLVEKDAEAMFLCVI